MRLRFSAASWLLALGAVLVVLTALFAIPSYLSWDSGTYHLAVRSFYKTGEFTIANGYKEFSSPLLAVGQTEVRDGKIVSQYPEYYTLLSLPFYILFGYRGLMVLNALAFVGICALVWRLARWFSTDRNAPLAAVGIYAFATYAITYTQSSYPHLASTFLVCASAWLLWGTVLGVDDSRVGLPPWSARMEGRCALAGLAFGIAVGVRLDSVFSAAALAVPLVICRRLGWRALLACGIAVLLPLLGLAWINAAKFGEFSPFSYGRVGHGYTSSLSYYLPAASVFALGLGILAWYRYRPFRPSRRDIAIAAIIAGAVLGLTPYGHRLLSGIFQLVVDLRIRPNIAEPALSRSADGAVIYWHSVKKSLLESCPYLILLAIPAIRNLLNNSNRANWLLWLVPAGYVGVFGYLAWHGSVCWNMRYLNPTLPFLAILASHELLRVAKYLPMQRWFFWAAVAIIWVLLDALFFSTLFTPELQEVLLLDGSLTIAVLLLLLQTAGLLARARLSVVCGRLLAGMLVFGLVWSSALAFSVDYPTDATVRFHLLSEARSLERHVAKNAVILTFWPDALWGLLESGKQPTIANYRLGPARDAVVLAERALDKGPVYWISPAQQRDPLTTQALAVLRASNIRHDLVFANPALRLYKLHSAAAASSKIGQDDTPPAAAGPR